MLDIRIRRRLVDVALTLARAKNEAAKFRSRFDGDLSEGSYTLRTPLGTLEGIYTVVAEPRAGDEPVAGTVEFVVQKKPMIVPGALIEAVLDRFLAQ